MTVCVCAAFPSVEFLFIQPATAGYVGRSHQRPNKDIGVHSGAPNASPQLEMVLING